MSRQNKDSKVEKFRLSLVDDQTHKYLWSFHFSRIELIVGLISAFVIICAVFYSIIAFTPVRTFIPGYPDAHTKRAAIQNAIKVDSLETIVSRWEIYSENLKRVLSGEEPFKIDTSGNVAASSLASGDMKEISRSDSLLRENVRKEEQFEVSGRDRRKLPIEGMHFFTPLKGVVSQEYDAVLHPYIDITAAANSVVMAVLDGTVVFAGWDDDAGYTIQLQHSNDIISIYKHNQKLLKKTGDKVSAGTPVALIGNTGKITTGDHLHFELWYQGEAVDPAKYINF